MATPYKSVSTGDKDNYNFYHSQVSNKMLLLLPYVTKMITMLFFLCKQLRINIECAFGELLQNWGILRKALPAQMGLRKNIVTVIALCKLHNFCIDQQIGRIEVGGTPRLLDTEYANILLEGGVRLENLQNNPSCPEQLLHGGEHFDDVRKVLLRSIRRKENVASMKLPWEMLLDVVTSQGLKCPTPSKWRDTVPDIKYDSQLP